MTKTRSGPKGLLLITVFRVCYPALRPRRTPALGPSGTSLDKAVALLPCSRIRACPGPGCRAAASAVALVASPRECPQPAVASRSSASHRLRDSPHTLREYAPAAPHYSDGDAEPHHAGELGVHGNRPRSPAELGTAR